MVSEIFMFDWVTTTPLRVLLSTSWKQFWVFSLWTYDRGILITFFRTDDILIILIVTVRKIVTLIVEGGNEHTLYIYAIASAPFCTIAI